MPRKYWVRGVKTAVHTPKGLFTKDAETIARTLIRRSKSLVSAIRTLQFFINRGGKGLSKARRAELEKAKKILHEKKEKGK